MNNSVAKPIREIDEAALEIVRGLPCCACGAKPPNDPHHPRAGGMGTKCSDYLVVPLCTSCHRALHDGGKDTFERNHPGYEDNARRLILKALVTERSRSAFHYEP